jgi:hypothetical protein
MIDMAGVEKPRDFAEEALSSGPQSLTLLGHLIARFKWQEDFGLPHWLRSLATLTHEDNASDDRAARDKRLE